MSKIFLLSLLFAFTSYSDALALIDLNVLSAESTSTLAIEELNAQEVAIDEEGVDRVEVVKKQRGLFLALVPITFTVKAVAYPDGAVEVFYPWYSAIMVDRDDEIRAQLKIAVDNALKSRLVGSVRAEGQSPNPRFSAEEAKVVEKRMIEVLSTPPSDNLNTQ